LHFRAPQDYLLLLLTMAAFLSLGLRRSRDFLQISLLVLCAIASFYSQADSWLVLLASIAVVAAGDSKPEPSSAARSVIFAAASAIVLLGIAILVRFPRDPEPMLAELGQTYPVVAADYIRDHHLPQPLFNPIPWGGFLAWYLPEYPVAIDGRTDLYGDDYNIHYAKVMNADEHYSTFPPLNQASTLILQKNSLMGVALATVPGFKTVYSDDVAVVLVREQP